LPAAPAQPLLLLPRLLGGLTAVLLLGWAVLGAARSTAAESYWNQAASAEGWLEQNGWEGSANDFARLIENATSAADLDPANAIYRHRAIVYRWRKIASERDPENGAVLLSKLDLQDVKQIVQDLHAARLLCPTLGSNQSMAGQLERFVLSDPAGPRHIRQGYRLSPDDPVTCFAAGLLDAVESKWDDSLAKFKTLNSSMFSDIVETYVHQVNRPDLALAAAGDDPERLMKLAEILQTLPDGTEADQKLKQMAEAAKQDAIARIKVKVNEPHASPALFAQMGYISAEEGDPNAAITYFRRALAMDYGNVNWRLGMARSLKDIGEVQQALAETRICLRLRPQDQGARRLIQELSVMPGALAQETKEPQHP
jgi:tetratricopeptide (TPR) repeat protein